MKADYYETLGIGKGADPDSIKKAFRKLAMQYHPDRNPGDSSAEIRFKEINEAYDVLKDEQKRAAYDRFGHAAFENGRGNGAGNGAHGFDFGGGFADIFEEMFGDMMGGRRQQDRNGRRGVDLRYNLEITLEEAYAGKQATIRVPASVACDECSGSGSEGGKKPVTCSSCNGAGRVRATQGFFTIERTCSRCQGMGKVIEHPCRKCRGQGRVAKERNIEVQIPAGIEDGTRIRLAAEGEAGVQGGDPGDLYLFVSVAPHPLFKRQNADLLCRVPISMVQACLGGQIEIPDIGGELIKVTIPESAQSGQRLRLRNKGMTILRQNKRGDLYLELNIEIPVNLSKKQKEILKEFEGSATDKNFPETSNFSKA